MAKGNNITIEFKAKGNEALNSAIKELDVATKRLTGKTSKYEKESKKTAIGNRLTANSFATMRSHLLLFNFAMGLGISQLIRFGKQAASVNLMKQSFNSLIAPTEKSSQSINKLRDATDGTVSDFKLLQQANNAMILGVSKNTDEMAEMFDMAQRLGKALGRDTASSVESLITGIGRQSRLMLDNIGIIVKVEDAQKKYALSLKKSVSSLTENEKKQAFNNAVMEAARKKVKLLGDEKSTTIEVFDRFSASTENAGVALGDFANNGIEPLINIMSSFNETITPQNLRIFASTIGVTSAGILIYSNRVKIATIANNLFTASLVKNPYVAAAMAAATLTAGVMKLVGAYKDAGDVTESLSGKTAVYIESLKELSVSQLKIEKNSLKTAISQAKNTEEYKKVAEAIKFENEMIEMHEKSIESLVNTQVKSRAESDVEITNYRKKINSRKETIAKLKEEGSAIFKVIKAKKLSIEEIDNFISILGESGTTIENYIAVNEDLERMFLSTSQGQKANIQGMIDGINANEIIIESDEKRIAVLKMLEEQLNKIGDKEKETQEKSMKAALAAGEQTLNMWQSNLDARMDAEISALQNSQAYIKADSEKRKSMEKDKRKEFQKEQTAIFRGNQAASLADIYFNTAKAVTNAMAGSTFTAGMPWTGIAVALGAAQAALVMSQKPPKYATGGIVGGNKHSQGGTLIEAEQGEFVMSRSAVEAVGIENMNRINKGGGGGVNLTFNNPIMTQDFVENDLADAIKEAARKGADFGIS